MAEPTTTQTQKKAPTQADGHEAVVIDLGKQKRRRVRRLRKGKGPLVDRARDAIDELREAGVVGANAQPVIVVVREKRRRFDWKF